MSDSKTSQKAGRPSSAYTQLGRALAAAFLVTVAIPTFIDVTVARHNPGFIGQLHVAMCVIYGITSFMIVLEAILACRVTGTSRLAKTGQLSTSTLPPCTAIIAAYLPNEQEIILDTIRHMLNTVDVPRDNFQVILAYNSPTPLAVEVELEGLALLDSRLTILHVHDSHSKAENVNAAVKIARGEIVAVYDADHFPESKCFQKAWRWLEKDNDVVQGRCVIGNWSDNWITRTVAVEFDNIYAVSHQGRARLSGTAIFGGSHGYWRKSVLESVRLDASMLTEDIDASVRALLDGKRIVHDREIISRELAPTRFMDWFFQRKRWAQGWLEVTLRHQSSLLSTPYLSAGQKSVWFYLLGWREMYPILSIQFFSMIFAAWILHVPIHWFNTPFYIASGIVNLGSGPLTLIITSSCSSREGRKGLGWWYWVYALLNLPYTLLKTIVTLVAQYAHLVRDREWLTTPRMTHLEEIAEPEEELCEEPLEVRGRLVSSVAESLGEDK